MEEDDKKFIEHIRDMRNLTYKSMVWSFFFVSFSFSYLILSNFSSRDLVDFHVNIQRLYNMYLYQSQDEPNDDFSRSSFVYRTIIIYRRLLTVCVFLEESLEMMEERRRSRLKMKVDD